MGEHVASEPWRRALPWFPSRAVRESVGGDTSGDPALPRFASSRAAIRDRVAGATSWGPALPRVVLGVLVLVAGLPVVLYSLRASITAMEEGALLLYPQLLLDGQWPNRDFEHVYGPGNLWTLAAVFQVTGVSLPAERMVALAYRLLLAASVYGITRPDGYVLASDDRHDVSSGRRSPGPIVRPSGAGSSDRRAGQAGALGAALTAWLLIAPIIAAYSSVGAVALASAGIWCALETRRTESLRRKRAFLLGAGLLAGAVVSYRFDFALAVLPAQAVLLWPGGSSDRPTLGDLRWWAAGGAAGVVPLLVHVVVVGFHETAAGMVLDPVVRHGAGRRLPVPPSLSRAPDSFTQIAHVLGETSWVPWSLPIQVSIMFWSVFVAAAVLGVVAWSRWRRDRETARTHIAVACLAAGLLPYALQRAGPGHVTLVLAVVLPLVPWAVGARREGRWDRRGAAVAGGCIVAVVLLAAPSFLGERILEQYRTLGAPEDVVQVTGGRGRTVPVPEGMAPDVQELVDYLREHTSPEDRLVVAPAELRKTNYNETYLYYLLPDLVPGTYHLEMNPRTANASWSDLPGDLEDADWVVLSNRYDGWREFNESAELGSGKATEVVRTQLRPVATIGSHYTVYRPRSSSG